MTLPDAGAAPERAAEGARGAIIGSQSELCMSRTHSAHHHTSLRTHYTQNSNEPADAL